MSSAPHIFDRHKMARQFARRPHQDIDFITALVVQDLSDRLATISRGFSKALILAPETRHLPIVIPTADGSVQFARLPTLAAETGEALVDPENLHLEDSDYDLIVSLFDLAAINDVPGFITQAHRHLRPDGLFMAAFVGGASLNELRRAWLSADSAHLNGAVARVAPFIGTRDAGGLLQNAGLALPVADVETHVVRYASALNLMAEIKQFGASNPLIGGSGLVTPNHLRSAVDTYAETASDPDGKVRATLEIVWISGWSPHDSQQQPLKPGSAKISLKDVLKPSSDA